jgi:hypothetical protein
MMRRNLRCNDEAQAGSLSTLFSPMSRFFQISGEG